VNLLLKSKVLRVFTIFAGASFDGFAEELNDRIRDTNANSWWVYSGEHRVKGNWGVYLETQIRRSDFAGRWQQYQQRDAVTYNFSPGAQVATGYVFTYTGRYGDFPAAQSFHEHRTYQQLILRHTYKKLFLEHRYRAEQRWIQNYTGTDQYFWRYQNRFRYQFRGTLPLTNPDAAGRQWYLSAGDEILLPYGPNHGTSAFDQNRAYAGVGYKFARNNSIEVNYLNQFVVQRNNRIEENNHTLRVMWVSTTAFGKLFR